MPSIDIDTMTRAIRPPSATILATDEALNPEFDPHCPSWREPDTGEAKYVFSIIADKTGSDMIRLKYTLPGLQDRILTEDADTKEDLSWIKGAAFGPVISDRGSYRTNRNVTAITAIIVEHDKGDAAFDAAIAKLKKAKLLSLVYTSPSYRKKDNERWRIVLPLSEPILLPPGIVPHSDESEVWFKAQYEKLAARVNGILGGKLADESFGLSLSYFFGRVAGNPDHRAEIIEGDYLDLRTDLDAERLFKGGCTEPPTPLKNKKQKALERNEFQKAVMEDVDKVRFALSRVDADHYPIWMEVGAALADEFGEDGRAIFHEWSNTSGKYQSDFCDAKFDDFAELSSFTIATVFHHADKADKNWREEWKTETKRDERKTSENEKGDNDSSLPRLVFINIGAWQDATIPPREWGVQGVIPLAVPNLLSGEGGTGKSLLALQCGAAHALGCGWLGMDVRPGNFMYFSAEDDEQELHRRLANVLRHNKAEFRDVANRMHLKALEDAVLATVDNSGIVKPTTLYKQLLQAVLDIRPVHLVLDSSADVFAGNEINRSEVRQFIGLMRHLCRAGNTTVTILAHPSLSGISSGSGTSGSTAWHNSVRSRAYFSTPKAGKDEDDIDPNMRLLEFKKSNYGPAGDSISLLWADGFYHVVTGGGAAYVIDAGRNKLCDETFIKLLKRFEVQRRYVSSNQYAKTYAPLLFAKEDDARKEGFGKPQFEAAMRRLFVAQKIENKIYGPPSRETTRLAVPK
jgi:RecA-family ATPase